MRKSGRGSNNREARLLPALVLAAAVWTAGCAVLAPTPSGDGLPAPETVVERLRERQDLVRTFAGRGSIKLKRDKSEHYLEVMVAAARPDRLRLQGFDFMGRPVLILAVDDKTLSFLDYRQARLFQGPATPENLSRFLPLGLSLPEVVALLSGGQPLAAYDRASLEARREVGGATWVLSLFRPRGDWVEKVWLTPGGLQVSRVELGHRGEKADYRLDFADYRTVEGRPPAETAPFQIKAADVQSTRELIISYTEVSLNPELPATLFQLEPPAGVVVEPLPE
ncbi:MAG: DUF4292 domain-containing protein [Thermodesulfobacteriota bacterium]